MAISASCLRPSWVLACLSWSVCKCSTNVRSLALDLHTTYHEGGSSFAKSAELMTRSRSLRSNRLSYPCQLYNVDNVQYHLELEIGKSCNHSERRQKFRVVPDTGSSDLWVFASNCSNCQGRRFNIEESCSAELLGKRVDFSYGDGSSASGSAFNDDVTISSLKLERQFVIQVDTLSMASGLFHSDGILGLAHHSKERIKEGKTFMARLFSQHPRMPHMFSVLLTDPGKSSKMVFGAPDVEGNAKEPLIYGKSYYMSVSELWLTSVYSLGFDRTGVVRRFENADEVGAPAMIDSGSSMIVLQPYLWDGLMEELQKYMRDCKIPHTDGGVMMCTCPVIFESIPKLVINLIDEQDIEHSFCMSPEEYVSKSLDPQTGKFNCVPTLQRGNRAQPVPLVLGMSFIREFYTSFDVGRHRIGFARSIYSRSPAGVVCSVHNSSDRTVWTVTVVAVAAAVAFALYSCCCGDVNACCGWPSCKVSSPCSLSLLNLKAGSYVTVTMPGWCSETTTPRDKPDNPLVGQSNGVLNVKQETGADSGVPDADEAMAGHVALVG